MNTRQLQCALDSDPQMREYERQVLALDQFLKIKIGKRGKKGIYICNDEPSTKTGNHWFLVIVESQKVYFIDSFAKLPAYYKIDRKLGTLKLPIVTISNILQNPFSTLCGEYCLFFAYHLSRNYNLGNILNYFTNDGVTNDYNIKRFVWEVYPGHERDVTNIFWINQNKTN